MPHHVKPPFSRQHRMINFFQPKFEERSRASESFTVVLLTYKREQVVIGLLDLLKGVKRAKEVLYVG